jgi:hypothetical protein
VEVRGQLHAPAAWEFARRPHKTGGWVDSRPGLGVWGEDKNFLPVAGIVFRFLRCPARSLVTIQTTQGVGKHKYYNLGLRSIHHKKRAFPTYRP